MIVGGTRLSSFAVGGEEGDGLMIVGGTRLSSFAVGGEGEIG
jgi:hypothetical protein